MGERFRKISSTDLSDNEDSGFLDIRVEAL